MKRDGTRTFNLAYQACCGNFCRAGSPARVEYTYIYSPLAASTRRDFGFRELIWSKNCLVDNCYEATNRLPRIDASFNHQGMICRCRPLESRIWSPARRLRR